MRGGRARGSLRRALARASCRCAGVLKAGAAYLPRDPGYPPDRLLDMVQNYVPVVVLVHGSPAGRLAGLDLPLLGAAEGV